MLSRARGVDTADLVRIEYELLFKYGAITLGNLYMLVTSSDIDEMVSPLPTIEILSFLYLLFFPANWLLWHLNQHPWLN